MSGLRYDRILAGTALALILAAPTSAYATPQIDSASKLAAVPTANATPGSEAPAASPPAPPAALPAASDPAGAAALSGAGATADVLDIVVTPAAPTVPDVTGTAVAPATAVPLAIAPNAGTPAVPPEPATAVEQSPPPDPLASLDPADRPVAEQINELLAAKSDKIFASKKERSAVETFYRSRNLLPLWLDQGAENARARSVAARLKAADADGLQSSDYKLPSFAGLTTPEALAEAELKFTQTVLTFARHLQAGRFPYNRVSNNIELPQMPPDQNVVLTRLADASDAGMAIEEFSPPHASYKALKKALADLQGKAGGGREQIADGALLKLNAKAPMQDPRVPQLRERLGLAGDPADLKYDAKLADAVKKFQGGADLPASGNLDAKTIKELNGPARGQQIDLVVANMERWRWLPRDLGKAHSIANLPDFSLKVVKDGATVWSTRIVIGKPNLATPLLTETMKYITVNPTWNVPPSIVHNEYLPALQQDPTVLSRMGIRVTSNRDGSVHMYMPPGEQNALGRLRFNFPNRFLVYQHDTADKHLFAHDVRAYSHGCMRVQDPAKYAEVLFGIARPSENWTADRIKKMFGGAEQDFQFPTHIPVHLTYQSAFVDDAGKLQIRRDIYGIDSRTVAAIKTQRGMVEPAPERGRQVAGTSSSAPSGYRRGGAQPQRELSFFEQLFGGGPPAARPTPPRRVAR
jgi:murein L,D-transpeptidase YcbB/YkuD